MRMLDYINQGGSITWLLLFMNVFGLSLVAWRFWVLKEYKKNWSIQTDLFLKEVKNVTLQDPFSFLKDLVSLKLAELEYGLSWIRVIATISPLLGLLGTVVGIFEAFQVIAAKGLDNPGDFASGIAYALITTIAGLIVAIPHTIAHNLLTTKLDQFEVQHEKELIEKLSQR